MKTARRDSTLEQACQAGLRLLSYRPRSRKEMELRLEKRFPTYVVQQAIHKLSERGYLDDVAFARAWRESRDAHRPRSASLVRRELIQRGVSGEIAEAAVARMDDEGNAYRAAAKPLRTLCDLGEPTFRRRLWAYLRRRGFSADLARRIVGQLWNEQRERDCI